MKINLTKLLTILTLSLGLGCAASIASAGTYGCHFIPGHWENGRWITQHRVCVPPTPVPVVHGCRFIAGHWQHGYWIPAQRHCW